MTYEDKIECDLVEYIMGLWHMRRIQFYASHQACKLNEKYVWRKLPGAKPDLADLYGNPIKESE